MRRTAVSICALLAFAAACSKSDSSTAATTTGPTPTPTPPVTTTPPPPAADTVNATPDEAFTPQGVTITLGQTVAFAFGSLGHNVIFSTAVAGAPEDIVGVNSNTIISRTFTTAGTFAYQCTIHPNMTGSVTVH